jgi:hypothetical protein
MHLSTKPPTENDTELLGYVHKLLIASPFIYAAAGELIASTETRQIAILKLAALLVSIAAIVLVLLMRSLVVGSAARRLRIVPDDPTALARWRVGQFAMLALSEAVVVCGLIFRLAGSSFHYAASFYLAGLGLLLVAQPRRS